MARRQHLNLLLAIGLVAVLTTFYLFSGSHSSPAGVAVPPLAAQGDQQRAAPAVVGSPRGDDDDDRGLDSLEGKPIGASEIEGLAAGLLTGESIAPKLGNATAKAELGRATWHFLHTTMARFPENPSADDSLALKTFMHLFARLYPCGECAEHFRKLLEMYPPQTSSRNAAAGWACFVHNEVNARLEKDEFDCNKIGDFYDCGCAEEGKEGEEGAGGADGEADEGDSD